MKEIVAGIFFKLISSIEKEFLMRIIYVIMLSFVTVSGISCSTMDDSKSEVEQFSSLDNAFIHIARQNNPQTMQVAREFEQYSRHDVVKTMDYGVFHIIYANLEKSIRGKGGNGPVYVFRENNNRYELVYHNSFDEMVNYVEIIEDDGNIKIHTYAHIGLGNGPNDPIVYKWNGNKFIYYE